MKTDIHVQLHDRATRGLPLTDHEQRQLAEWYSIRNALESGVMNAGPDDSAPLTLLEDQILLARTQLLKASRQLTDLLTHNDHLRLEIMLLQEQIMRNPALQPA